jgi:ATP-binding cassette subfamily F protein uup
MLTQLGIQRPDQRVSTLSGGERRRVALAKILIARPDLAILDEPTNHLDAETIDWLEQYLLDEYPGAVMLVTHDRYLLDRVATRTLEVATGEVHAYDGGYESYLEQKAERIAHAARTEQNRQNFLRRELEWLRRQPKARTGKQKARIDRAEAAMSVRPVAEETAPSFELSRARVGKTILEVRDLSVDAGGRRLIEGLELFVTEGERIGIVGKSGSGKTTLLRTLLGTHPPAAGSVVLGQNTRIAYFDQERSGLDDTQTVLESVLAGDGNAVEAYAYLERFGFDRQQQRQAVGSLSGGERARVALARLLKQSTNLLVLDEPTNDLDVATLSALESLLIEHGVTALIVTHDRWFLDRVATAILAFEPGGRVVRYAGNYSDWRRTLAALQAASQPAASARAEPARAAPPARKKKLGFAEERELEALPDRIDALERRVAEHSEALASPATYASGGQDVAGIHRALEAAKQELEALMTRWEELETKKLA